MQKRELQWKVPPEWDIREDLDIATRLISYDKASMETVKDGFSKGTLRPVKVVKKR
jgi:hypothetical protein